MVLGRHRLVVVALAATAAVSLGAGLLRHGSAPLATRDIDAARFAASGPVGRGITVEAVWPVPPDEAFALMTDSAAWRDRFQVESRIDLAIGGRFEILFGAGVSPEGQQGSEGCQILSYVPGEMLSFSWNAPPRFEEREQHTWVVITFLPGPSAGTTRLHLRHVGFGEGGRWPEVEAYFQNAWIRLLGAMGEDLG